MALAALGLLHGDGTLATAALAELSRHKHNSEFLFFRYFFYYRFSFLHFYLSLSVVFYTKFESFKI